MSDRKIFDVALGFLVVVVLLMGTSSVQAEALVDGKQVYMRYCATCHGADGKGGGPMAEVLKPTPTNLTLIAKFSEGKFPYQEVFEIIDGRGNVMGHGSGQMPIWGDAFKRSPEDHAPSAMIFELVHYLKGIQTD